MRRRDKRMQTLGVLRAAQTADLYAEALSRRGRPGDELKVEALHALVLMLEVGAGEISALVDKPRPRSSSNVVPFRKGGA